MKRVTKMLFVAAVSLSLFAACKKDKTAEPTPEPDFTEVSKYVKKYKNGAVEVTKYPMDTTNITDRKYFNFDKMAFVDASKAKTNEWDIAFETLYALTILPNNGKANENFPWFGNTTNVVVGGIIKPYDELTAIPDDFTFPAKLTNLTTAEFDNTETRKSLITWANEVYNTDGEFSHLVIWKGRSFIWKLNDGRYVKFEMINSYNNAPEKNGLKSRPGYLSFRYFVAKAGSKDVNTK